MGKLSTALNSYTTIGLDTSVFIYHLESHPNYLPLTQELLEGIEQGKWRAVTSVITLMEISVVPFKIKREDIAGKYEALFVNFPNLLILDINRTITRQAARLRATHQLRPPDALQIAACLSAGAKIFVTNDNRLTQICPLMEVVILDDYL